MPLSPGDKLGSYEILGPIGAGGMGEVYRARDSKLNRDVAVKTLPVSLAADAQYMARFEREAQLLAALNHPNIAQIYGIEQGAIVMELVEGANLKGPLPIDETIAIASQIAVGLEAAHEKGIIHRDLKPANIRVTPDGTIKILDFGLAKAADAAPATSTNPSISPTLTINATQAGMILGTAAYMSPEQARGKSVDRRADIWAFGVILYELITGRALYGSGETISDVLAAVITSEPDFSVIPDRLRPLVRACLEKDPRKRLRDIGDWQRLLPAADTASAAAATSPAKPSWLPWTVAAAFAIGAFAFAFLWMRGTGAAPTPSTVRFSIPLDPKALPTASSSTQWVPSPDGLHLAMVVADHGTNNLWLRHLNATEAHKLDKTEGANFPFWSPDGQSIAFFAGGKLKRVATSGGDLQTICDVEVNAVNAGNGGAWTKDGFIIFAAKTHPLMRVPAIGGTAPSPVTKLEGGESGHSWPQVLPDGRHVLYHAFAENSTDAAIYVQEIGSSNRVQVLKTQTRAIWAPPGFLLFGREDSLYAQRLNGRSFQLEGDPFPVAEEVIINETTGRSTFATSQTGVLVYRRGTSRSERQLTWRDRSGNLLKQVGKPIVSEAAPVLSPDERSAALIVGQAGGVSVVDLETGVSTPLSQRAGRVSSYVPVVWSPDSKRLAFILEAGGVAMVTVASAQVTTLTRQQLVLDDWAADGNTLLAHDGFGNQLSLLSLSDGFPLKRLMTAPNRQTSHKLSPDSKYLASASYEGGGYEIYIESFPSFSVKKRISTGGGPRAIWVRNGKEIIYQSPDGLITAVEIQTGNEIVAGKPKPLFRVDDQGGFWPSSDGQRFLVNEPVKTDKPNQGDLIVVLNWIAELGKPSRSAANPF